MANYGHTNGKKIDFLKTTLRKNSNRHYFLMMIIDYKQAKEEH
jgi:hypothetical protein